MTMKSLLARTVLALTMLFSPAAWSAVSLTIDIAPPSLPVYAQPPVPGEGYIWAPGYWSWSEGDRDYYWVPGTWVLAPSVGVLWTPGYWAFEGAGYFWHSGYWGTQVGFYGGLNYGYGYTGSGYQGGRWDHGAFRYNRAASNVGTQGVHNVYSAKVVGSTGGAHFSFNGGKSGVTARPTASQRQLQTIEHAGPSAEQLQHEHTALTTPTQRATGPHGVPQVAATPKPSAFSGPGIEHIRPEPGARPSQREAQPAVHQERSRQQGDARAAQAPAEEPRKEH